MLNSALIQSPLINKLYIEVLGFQITQSAHASFILRGVILSRPSQFSKACSWFPLGQGCQDSVYFLCHMQSYSLFNYFSHFKKQIYTQLDLQEVCRMLCRKTHKPAFYSQQNVEKLQMRPRGRLRTRWRDDVSWLV